jgi:hypothetical protein
MTSKDFKKILSDRLSDVLKRRSFKKSGNYFSFSNGDLTYYIWLQSSRNSTATILVLTLNIEITSTLLYRLEGVSIPEKDRRHYTRRIGSFLDNPIDKWWTIDDERAARKSADEISELILNRVLPTFDDLKSTEDLRNLWREGTCPGLTDKMRKEYLSLLDNAQ